MGNGRILKGVWGQKWLVGIFGNKVGHPKLKWRQRRLEQGSEIAHQEYYLLVWPRSPGGKHFETQEREGPGAHPRGVSTAIQTDTSLATMEGHKMWGAWLAQSV